MSPFEGTAYGRQAQETRFQIGDAIMANDKAPAGYRDRRGFITEIGSDGREFRVEFEDGLQPTTGYLVSKWLDR